MKEILINYLFIFILLQIFSNFPCYGFLDTPIIQKWTFNCQIHSDFKVKLQEAIWKVIYYMIPNIRHCGKGKTIKRIKISVISRSCAEEHWICGAQGFLGQWKFSVWYYNGKYMSFSIFQTQRIYKIMREPHENCELWVTVVCSWRFFNCNKWTSLVGSLLLTFSR